jgi:hypothetical protein
MHTYFSMLSTDLSHGRRVMVAGRPQAALERTSHAGNRTIDRIFPSRASNVEERCDIVPERKQRDDVPSRCRDG